MPNLSPYKVFLVDCIGAFLSAVFLFTIAKLFDGFGMPQTALSLLVVIAIVYSLFSCCCYFFTPTVWQPFLFAIVTGNVLYSLLTMFLLVYYYHQLGWPGVTYFISELVVLFLVVSLEVKTLLRAK